MGTRIQFDKGASKHVHCFATKKIKKVCKDCKSPIKVREKCLVPRCDYEQTGKLKCRCNA